MTKPCIVPKCKTGYRSLKVKRSVFKVPTNSERLKKWQAAIPHITSSHYVCEKHFEEQYILRKWIKHDASGKAIAEVPYNHPRLHESAIPTIFDNTRETPEIVSVLNFDPVTEYVDHPPMENKLAVEGTSINQYLITDNDISNRIIQTPVNDIVGNINVEPQPYSILPCIDIADVPIAAETIIPAIHRPTFNISSVAISENESTTHPNSIGKYCTTLPTSWSVGQLPIEPDQHLVFSYVTVVKKQGIDTPVTERYVTLDAQKKLRYYVYGNGVNVDKMNLVKELDNIETLPSILIRFQYMNLCCGIGDVNKHFLQIEDVFKNHIDECHHRECSLLWNKKRCDSCTNLRRMVLQKERRSINPRYPHRISGLLNPLDEYKLRALRKKMMRERREKNRAKFRVFKLKESLKVKELEIAAMEDFALDMECSKLKVPDAQKIAMKEIIAAASKKDARGRRYTEEWIMLCMLMNIRSPGYYEFLRKNNVMPLPCTRTIRSYFSLLNTKCGFDEEFNKLLTKHFDTKTPMQRHGILLLDEINLRKSIAVCSKNLTYVGLTDFGNDGPQSSDISEQATHGLVMMFQPLADKYTQPIAVFASKNPVKGDELAKLVVKAIAYLEKSGAIIHGVVADGATTNKKMWSLLDIRGSVHGTKTWFTHPLDNDRKIFVFSDVPHIFKNIRNRLYNKRRLRIDPKKKYVEWRFLEVLFDLDTKHAANARACPRLSKRHIQLDNTSKMRVRLATQIFSNSVAQGLAFYASQKCKELVGCEETIFFCKFMNDTFDALNRKMPNEGLTPESEDFKTLQHTLQWLNDWQTAVIEGKLPPDEFLTVETAEGLRVSLKSTMDMCNYLKQNFGFKYLLTGKVNQDNLEKFFGTIRQAAGCNDHPTCPTFLQLYKLLSVYSVIKPPKYGNCTVTETPQPRILVSLRELKDLSSEKSESKMAKYREEIRKKLDAVLQHGEWEADDLIEYNFDHDYTLSPTIDCIVYYVTGFLF